MVEAEIFNQAALLVAAGLDTTSNSLNVGLYHIIKDKSLRKTLEDEIMAAWPEKDSPFSFEQAEKLCFLVSHLSNQHDERAVINFIDRRC